YYATLPFVWFSGAQDFDHLSEVPLRAVAVFLGIALIPLLLLLQDALGRLGVIFAGALTALSPAMVFYSRYFIHEMLLVWFTLLLIVAGWRYYRRPTATWAIVAGLGLGLMYATKETFVFQVAALLGALVGTSYWDTRSTALAPTHVTHWNGRHAFLALAAALVVSRV